MKKNLLIFNFAFLIFNYSSAQNPLVKQWDYRYGGTSVEFLHQIHPTKDGNYILGGSSGSPISGDKTQNTVGSADYWIVKIDTSGNKLWDIDIGGTLDDEFSFMQPIPDGGYILGGSSPSPAGGDKTQPSWGSDDYWIVKTDSMCSKLWDKDFGGDTIDYLYSLIQTPDGGYLLGGSSLSGMSGDKTQPSFGKLDYWVVKTDSLGNKQWDKGFGGTENDHLRSMQNTDDGGYLVAGYSYSGISGNKSLPNWDTTNATPDYWIIKIDSLGNKLWEKILGGTKGDHLSVLQKIPGGGYIISGYSYSSISGDKTQDTVGSADYWVIKTDSLCNKQWDKTFGGPGMEFETRTAFQTIDGGFLITGISHSNAGGDKTENNLGSSQTWMVKTDGQGNKEWDKTIKTLGIGGRCSAIQNTDGCYLIASMQDGNIGGEKTQNSWGSWDYWVIKYCDTTLTTSIPSLNIHSSMVAIHPNPANSSLTLSFSFPSNQLIELRIYNTLGKVQLSESFKTFGKFAGEKFEKEINVKNLDAGIYFLSVWSPSEQVKMKEGIINKKFMIQK